MNLGYPCSNLTIGKTASRTFRLASYTDERLLELVESNLEMLEIILRWNIDHHISLFRISSGTVPFASHPVMTADWQTQFESRFQRIGALIRSAGMRINMHPGQYTLLNSPQAEVVQRSVAELHYHAELMDLMGLDASHKIQIHVGGLYGDRDDAIDRFVEMYHALPEPIRQRLVIENDERQYSLADNLVIHERTSIPVLFDIFHHRLFNRGEALAEAMNAATDTWGAQDGAPMLDYSSQHPDRQAGAHALSINLEDFAPVAALLRDRNLDMMLEIKDKEQSVLRAQAYLDSLTDLQ